MFHVIEAVRIVGVPRLVWTSSETAPGYMTGDPVLLPDRLPFDEEHPLRPREAYALSKVVGEQMVDALVRKRDNAVPVSAVSIRPSLVTTDEMYGGCIAQVRDGAPPVGDLERPDAGALSIAKARRLFGWEPRAGLAA